MGPALPAILKNIVEACGSSESGDGSLAGPTVVKKLAMEAPKAHLSSANGL